MPQVAGGLDQLTLSMEKSQQDGTFTAQMRWVSDTESSAVGGPAAIGHPSSLPPAPDNRPRMAQARPSAGVSHGFDFAFVIHRRRVVHRYDWRGLPRAAGRLGGDMKLFKRIAQRARHIHRTANDLGMTTAEYAVGTIAAVAFAVVLYKVIQSPSVSSMLSSIISSALSAI